MKKVLLSTGFSIILLVCLYRTFQYYEELKLQHSKYQKKWFVKRSSKCPIATAYYWIVTIPSCIGVGIAVVLNILETIDYVFSTGIVQLPWQLIFGVYFSVPLFMVGSFLIFAIISGLIDRFGGKNG